MDRAGGYLAFRALEQDAAAYADLIVVMRTEASANADAGRLARAGAEGAAVEDLAPLQSWEVGA